MLASAWRLPPKFSVEFRDVRGLRAAEAVDGLPPIGDDPYIGPGVRNGLQQGIARRVHVLKLIDEDVLEAGQVFLDLRILPDEPYRERDQIPEIDGVVFGQESFVNPVDFGDLLELFGALALRLGRGRRRRGIGGGAILGGRDQLVLAA